MKDIYRNERDGQGARRVVVEDKSKETLASFTAEFNKAEEEKRLAPVRKAVAEENTKLREIYQQVQKFFSLPMDELRHYSDREAPVDFEEYAIQSGDRDQAVEQTAADEFLTQTNARGLVLNDEGWYRYWRYLAVLKVHQHIALTVANMQRALERLNYLGCFQPREIEKGSIPLPAYAQPQPTEPQESERDRRDRLDRENIENVDTSTREGQAAARRYIGERYGNEVNAMWQQFADFMETTYGVDIRTPKIQKFAGDWADRNNKNLLNPAHLNELRRAMDKQGFLALSVLTKDERLAQSIENSDLSDYQVKANIRRRQQEINDAALLKARG